MSKEIFKHYFIAFVRFWKDSGEPWNVVFGNGAEVSFINVPYERTKSGKGKHEIIPFEQDAVKMKLLENTRKKDK